MRKLIYRVGDVTAEDYGGGGLVQTPYGYYTLEWTPGLEGEGVAYVENPAQVPLTVYRVPVELGVVDALRDLDWVDWPSVLESIGDESAIEDLDPHTGGPALYEMVASYYGWGEFDPNPMTYPYHRVARMWSGKEHGFPKRLRSA